MDPLESEFEQRLRDSISESITLGYTPTRFIQMLDAHSGKETAKLLVKSGEIQDGLRRIVQMGHHELAMESIMLEPQFEPLFDPSDLDAARWRLNNASVIGR